jgi:branched-chain amino acid transport system permease protein
MVAFAMQLRFIPLLSEGEPPGALAAAFVSGCLLILQAIAAVLVLRTSRLINFGQYALGAASGLVFYTLVRHSFFLALTVQTCPACFGTGVSRDGDFIQTHPAVFLSQLMADGKQGWISANYWIALVLAIVVAPLLAYLAYVLVISPLSRAPRLIASIATIGVGALATGVVATALASFQDQDQATRGIFNPFPNVTWTWDSVPFHPADVLVVAVTLATILGLLALRITKTGTAVRALSEDSTRAQTLGINTASVGGLVWLLAGLFAGLTSILQVMQQPSGGAPQVAGLDSPLAVEVLVIAIFARLVSMPRAVMAALLMAIIAQGLYWNLHTPIPFVGLLAVLVGAALLLQRFRPSRAEQESTASYLAAKEARPMPLQLRRLPDVRGYARWLAAVVVIGIAGYPLVMSPAQVNLGTVIVIYAILGLSLLILTGWAGQVSLGHMALAGAGAYAAAVVRDRLGLDITLCLLAGGIVGALLAVAIGLPALRLRGLHLAIATLAFARAMSDVGLNSTYLGRWLPVQITTPSWGWINLADDRYYFYFAVACLLLVIAAVAGIRRSRTARVLIAARDNETAAQAFGINLLRVRLVAFAGSGFIAAVAGGLLAFSQGTVQPLAYAPAESINLFTVIVVGGLGSIVGPVLGALYYGLPLIFPGSLFNGLTTGLGLILIILFVPGGLGSLAFRARDAVLRRVAIRHRIVVPGLVEASDLGRQAALAPERGRAPVPAGRYSLDGQWTGAAAEGTTVGS